MTAAKAPLWATQKEGRTFTRMPVTMMLNGAELTVPLHVITGCNPGPTLGIITNTHGDEFLATIAIREFIISRKSLGGMQTDLDSRVLDGAGTPIPGLYAAGEAAGFGGGGMNGLRGLEGTFLGGCILSARRAARAIAKH